MLAEIDTNGGETLIETRRRLAAKAFTRTAAYDAAIGQWFARTLGDPAPAYAAFGGKAHRGAALWRKSASDRRLLQERRRRVGVATARQVQGKELSYNNINDTDAAFECVAEFEPAIAAACVIVKHANPCGAAIASSVHEAYLKALASDR